MNIVKGQTWDILDHGYIKLIDHMGTDETLIEAARMSTNKGFIGWSPYSRCNSCGLVLFEEDKPVHVSLEECPGHKLVHYPAGDFGLLETLWEEHHTSPFEMAELAIEVQAPIVVVREWFRHRTQAYNELSGRYAVMPDIHYLPPLERVQKQSTANKQGSAEAMERTWAQHYLVELASQQATIYDSYESWVESGLAKEIARLNTPVSRYTRFRAKTDLLNWLKFLDRRMRSNAQWEIRQYADTIGEDIIKELWPRSWSLFEEYTLYATTFSRSEMTVLKKMVAMLEHAAPLALKMAYKDGLAERRVRKFLQKLDLTAKEKA